MIARFLATGFGDGILRALFRSSKSSTQFFATQGCSKLVFYHKPPLAAEVATSSVVLVQEGVHRLHPYMCKSGRHLNLASTSHHIARVTRYIFDQHVSFQVSAVVIIKSYHMSMNVSVSKSIITTMSISNMKCLLIFLAIIAGSQSTHLGYRNIAYFANWYVSLPNVLPTPWS